MIGYFLQHDKKLLRRYKGLFLHIFIQKGYTLKTCSVCLPTQIIDYK